VNQMWPTASFAEHVDLLTGFPFKSSHFCRDDDAIPLLKGSVVQPGYLDWNDCERLPQEMAASFGDYCLQVGDVILAMDRPWLTSGLKCSWIKPSDPRSLLVQRVARLRGTNGLTTDYLRYLVASKAFEDYIAPITTGVNVPHISPAQIKAFQFLLPPVPIQRKITAVLSAYDDLIENDNRRIRLLEEMAQRIYREWFVDFRYPGHDTIQLVDSPLGRIPRGWSVHTISGVASRERYAVTGGPFGSKLGTKDYIARGVPVIRGTNLAVGGGFRDSDFVFVSDAKADTMLSCLAHRGDILVTQRGTLGQVGLIPPSARFYRYLLSQSQMKITVDPEMGSAQYLYAALRSPEVTARLLGHAMTAGVPHINLSLLRNFQVVWPERGLHERFDHYVQSLGEQVELLTRSIENARVTRSLLLPRLISGAIDVTDLDIELPAAAA
jgi:type I restriction enzyme, S subunit